MSIKNMFKTVVYSIARQLGMELQEKSDYGCAFETDGFNPTAIGAAVISDIAVDDSEIIVKGDNARAVAIRECAEIYSDDIRFAAACVALGTGDVLVRPYTDGTSIGFSIIKNGDFAIAEAVGNVIKACIMCIESYSDGKGEYSLYETQCLSKGTDSMGGEVSYVEIHRFAAKDDKQVDISTTRWADIKTEDIIASEQLLLGRIKCPTLNRSAPNDINGVPITHGCDGIIKNIRKRYEQFNDEFDRKEVKLFADRTLFEVSGEDADGKPIRSVPGGRRGVFQLIKGVGSNSNKVSDMIDVYSPEFRDASLIAAENFNLSVLELACGFSRGVFTAPETAFSTATEVRNSLKKTFSFIKQFRHRMEAGEKQLFAAVDILMNRNSVTPMGEWDITFDWSYDYIEEMRERFNQLLQAHGAGVISDAELRGWVMNEKPEDAEKAVAKLKAAFEEDEDDITAGDDGAAQFAE